MRSGWLSLLGHPHRGAVRLSFQAYGLAFLRDIFKSGGQTKGSYSAAARKNGKIGDRGGPGSWLTWSVPSGGLVAGAAGVCSISKAES